MKVLQLITTLSSGGAELHLLTLCRRLKKQGVEIVVACMSEYGKDGRTLRGEFENAGIRVICVGNGHRFELRSFSSIAHLVEIEQPDILHTHLPRADLLGAIARFLNPSVAWVCSVHAIYSYDWSGRWTLPLFHFVWRRADAMLCISHAVKDWLINCGVPADMTQVIHYGIELEEFLQPQLDLRKQWALNGSVIVGSIGRLEPRKGHDRLIDAMPGICESVPNALLLIAGQDSWGYGATLQRRIDELGFGEKIRMVGFQNDIASFLGALDLFAFATKSEGFGQVAVEAMAVGKAVVMTNIAPLTEIVVDGETGRLVDTGSADSFANVIIPLLKDPAERARMGALGRARVKEFFAAERMSQKTLSLYEDVLRRRSTLRASA